MDAVSIISSVSKIAIVAFAVTLVVVIYEVVVLMKKQRESHVHDDNVVIPDFDQAAPVDKHFTEISVTPGQAPVASAAIEPTSSRLPLIIAGIVALVLIAGVGYFFVVKPRQQASKGGKGSPIAQVTGKPTSVPTRAPSPTRAPTATRAPSPTATTQVTSKPTLAVTGAPTGAVTGSVSPTLSISAATTAKPTSTALPKAGTFQMPLLISVVSITLIYLALIL